MAIYKEITEKPCVYLPMGIIMDPDLDMEERGFMATLYSLPEDTYFSLEIMAELSCDEISTIRRVFRKLVAKGYIVPCGNGYGKIRFSPAD